MANKNNSGAKFSPPSGKQHPPRAGTGADHAVGGVHSAGRLVKTGAGKSPAMPMKMKLSGKQQMPSRKMPS